jgi:hypothetical protein
MALFSKFIKICFTLDLSPTTASMILLSTIYEMFRSLAIAVYSTTPKADSTHSVMKKGASSSRNFLAYLYKLRKSGNLLEDEKNPKYQLQEQVAILQNSQYDVHSLVVLN